MPCVGFLVEKHAVSTLLLQPVADCYDFGSVFTRVTEKNARHGMALAGTCFHISASELTIRLDKVAGFLQRLCHLRKIAAASSGKSSSLAGHPEVAQT
jgi:hypothetical protein